MRREHKHLLPPLCFYSIDYASKTERLLREMNKYKQQCIAVIDKVCVVHWPLHSAPPFPQLPDAFACPYSR